MAKILMTLDLSTRSTGWATFNKKTKKPIAYGAIKPTRIQGISKMRYPESGYERIINMSNQVKDLVAEHDPDEIVIEEVNRGRNRIAQKSLDALHYFVLDRLRLLDKEWIGYVTYIDSNGIKGWRGKLGLRLTPEDKAFNRSLRAKPKTKALKARVVDWKTLAARYINERFKIGLEIIERPSDADIADALCIGCAILKK